MVKINYVLSDRIVNLLADLVEYLAHMEHRSEPFMRGKLLAADTEYTISMIYNMLALDRDNVDRGSISDMVLGKIPKSPEVIDIDRIFNVSLNLNPLSVSDLLRTHEMMMDGWGQEPGKFRSKGSTISPRDCFVRVMTPVSTIEPLMDELTEWYRKSEAHPLVRAVIYYYCFEMIHPFADGNQRLGLIWMRLLLAKWKPIFYYIPIENYLLRRKKEFYNIMTASSGDCSRLVEFMLRVFYCAVEEYDMHLSHRQTATESMNRLLDAMKAGETYTNREMMDLVNIRHRPTFRDNYLLPCIAAGLIAMTIPDKPNSKNQRYRKISV